MHYKRFISVPFRNFSYWKVLNWYAELVKPIPRKAPYRHVVQIGDPILRLQAEPVPIQEIPYRRTQNIIREMRNMCTAYNCHGLAAPQIGVSLQIIMIQLSDKHLKSFTSEEIKSRDITTLPLTVIINPQLKILDYTKNVFSESCASIRGFGADVSRHKAVVLKGYSPNGEHIQLEAKGWIARIIQHEMDHLNGRLYTDIMDRKSFACSCCNIINDYNGKVQLPYGPK